MEEIGEKMTGYIDQLNEGLDESVKARTQAAVARRARAGYLGRNDPDRVHQCATSDETELVGALIPNLAVEQPVARVEPATLEEVEETERLLSNTDFTFSADDPDASLTYYRRSRKARI
jgi:hypothetical protein